MNDHRSHASDVPTPKTAESTVPSEGKWTQWSSRIMWVSMLLLAIVLGRNGWEAHQQHQRLRAVRCDKPAFDFGQAFTGDTIEHTFQVSNVGRVPLEVKKVTASCGCTTVATKLEGTLIGPNESFNVPVTLTLSGLEEGEFEKSVVVQFAGEPKLQSTLKLTGTVKKAWTWSAETVTFDNIQKDEVASRTIELRRCPEAPPDELPQIVPPSTKLLRLDIEDVTEPDGTLIRRTTVTTVPPLPSGRQDAYLYAYMAGSPVPISPIRIILIVAE